MLIRTAWSGSTLLACYRLGAHVQQNKIGFLRRSNRGTRVYQDVLYKRFAAPVPSAWCPSNKQTTQNWDRLFLPDSLPEHRLIWSTWGINLMETTATSPITWTTGPNSMWSTMQSIKSYHGQTCNVKLMNNQKQQGFRDCGLFAIANATSLCFGDDPTFLEFEQNEMRQHLLDCIEKGQMTPFPHNVSDAKRKKRCRMTQSC